MRKKFTGAILFLVLSVFVGSLYPIIYGNRGCDIIDPYQCDTGGDGSGTGDTAVPLSNVSVGYLIAEAGGLFLDSQSCWTAFTKSVELIETRGDDAFDVSYLERAIIAMEKARAYYLDIFAIFENSKYKADVVERLKAFDYKGFEIKHNLIHDIFDGVSITLKSADVKAVYAKLLNDMEIILDSLYKIRENPERYDITDVWNVSQKYARSLLYGQYVTRVFYEIKK